MQREILARVLDQTLRLVFWFGEGGGLWGLASEEARTEAIAEKEGACGDAEGHHDEVEEGNADEGEADEAEAGAGGEAAEDQAELLAEAQASPLEGGVEEV